MKASTESLLINAIDTNAEIQDDCRIMHEKYLDLYNKAKTIKKYIKMRDVVKNEGISKAALKFADYATGLVRNCNIDMDAAIKMSDAERKNYVVKAIDTYEKSTRSEIGSTLRHMLEISLADINKPVDYPEVKTYTDRKVLMYNKLAYENLSATLSSILGAVGAIINKNVSYDVMQKTLKDQLSMDLHMVNTTISTEGLVAMDVPQPVMQSVSDAEFSNAEDLNDVSDLLNKFGRKKVLTKIQGLPLTIQKTINESKTLITDIKKAHLLAQLIMSVKNSMLMIKNYHKVTLDDISNEGFFGNLRDNGTISSMNHKQAAMLFEGFANNLSKMSNNDVEFLFNKTIDRKMYPAQVILKLGTEFLPIATKVGQMIHSVDIGSRERDTLNTIANMYSAKISALSDLIENAENTKNLTLKQLGYTKASLIQAMKLGAKILQTMPLEIYDAITYEAMDMDITYVIDYGFMFFKWDMYGIVRRA